MEHNEDTEILAKLGILNSKLESPNKMSVVKLESRRVRAVLSGTASSLSDDSDSEIIFDRNALLNARKRRRRKRSAARHITNFLGNETLKWKLFCLACIFLCMGLSTTIIGLTKPDLMANVHSTSLLDYSRIFVFGGLGYFVGGVFVSLVFTRVNAYICLLFLMVSSIPFTTLMIYQTQLGNLKFFFFLQGLLFSAIERGSFFIIYGILKGDKRTLFILYATFALGGALSSIFATEEVFSRASVISQRAHLLTKREIVNLNSTSELAANLNDDVVNVTIHEEPVAVTRPHSAIGIDQEPDSKTRENTERRKQILSPKTNTPTIDCSGENGAKSANCQTTSNDKKATSKLTTTTRPTTPTKTTTTTRATTTTPSTTTQKSSPISPAEATPVNRARNRYMDSTATTKTSSFVDQMKEGLNDRMQKGLAQVNSASRLAYILIMVISLISVGFLVLSFCCCCIRFNLIADPRISQIQLEYDAQLSAKLPNSTLLLSSICWVLQSLPESTLIAFLPHYILSSTDETLRTQNNTAFFSCGFWIAVAVFRALVASCPQISTFSMLPKLCYLIGVPFCFLFRYWFAESQGSIFGELFILGFFAASLPQLTFAWLQVRLDASPYLLTKYYFTSLSLAKIFGPVLAVWALESAESNRALISLLIWILALSGFFYFLLARSVDPLSRKRQIHELSSDINGRRSSSAAAQSAAKPRTRKGQYEALVDENQSDADIEMDYILSDSSDSI